MGGLPSRQEATELLQKHVKDEYQLMHAKMVATVLEVYANKFGDSPELWFITGFLHDLDYFEFPDEHPQKSLEWFREWGYPKELIHAVAAHAHERSGIEPQTKLACCLCACDELCGFLYAYSLMRPDGFSGMKASSVKKKFKDKAFAAKINREDISYGIEKLGVDFSDHIEFVIGVLEKHF